MQAAQSKPIIVIPAFNEEEWVGRTIGLVRKTGIQAKIIVVDDGSTDKTAEVAAKAGCEVIRLKKNFGKANAVFAGMKTALRQGPTSILLLDADLLAVPKTALESLIRPADLASAKRKIEMGVMPCAERGGFQPTISFSGIRSFSVPAAAKLLSSKFKKVPKGYGLEIFLNHFFPRRTLFEHQGLESRRAVPQAKLGIKQSNDMARMLKLANKRNRHWR